VERKTLEQYGRDQTRYHFSYHKAPRIFDPKMRRIPQINRLENVIVQKLDELNWPPIVVYKMLSIDPARKNWLYAHGSTGDAAGQMH
jgi:hypothetical protein